MDLLEKLKDKIINGEAIKIVECIEEKEKKKEQEDEND